MTARIATSGALAALLVFGAAGVRAADTGTTAGGTQTSSTQAAQPDAQRPYGWHMMTPAEMQAYHAQMMAAKTPAEREQIRQAHHAEMMARARERGVTLPEQPMGQGMMGTGTRSGMGNGMTLGTTMASGMHPGMMSGGMGTGGGTTSIGGKCFISGKGMSPGPCR